MPSKSKRRPRSPARALGLFLLLNIIPLGAGAVLFVLWQRGEIVIEQPPPGFGLNLAVAGGAIALLFLSASGMLPVAHGAVKGARAGRRESVAVLKGQGEGSKFLALLAWPAHALVTLIAWPIRFLLIVLSFALIGVVVVFLIRCAQPEFLEEPIQRVLSWRWS